MTKILIIIQLLFFVACTQKKEVTESNVYYTCSMHQQIHESKMGTCPICQMDLTKIVVNPNQKGKIKLSPSQIQLANIVIDTAKIGKISEEIQLHAKLVVNENNVKTINSRVEGRVEKLYFKNVGDAIKVGDLLYEMYSEDLLSVEKEYLIAKDRQNQQMMLSAKNKLLLWGLTEVQINKLQSINDLHSRVSIYSKVSGTIQEISINEGDNVNEGGLIFKIVDLSTLWIECQVFSNEIEFVKVNKTVDFVVSAFPNERLKGKINFVSPELQNGNQIVVARIEIKNPANKYQTGMLAIVNLQTKENQGLILPLKSVLQTEKTSKIWIQNSEGSFESRQVKVGMQNSESIEIVSGLKVGEKVVVSGTYLLESEAVFKNE